MAALSRTEDMLIEVPENHNAHSDMTTQNPVEGMRGISLLTHRPSTEPPTIGSRLYLGATLPYYALISPHSRLSLTDGRDVATNSAGGPPARSRAGVDLLRLAH
jgi:hypothetical protein